MPMQSMECRVRPKPRMRRLPARPGAVRGPKVDAPMNYYTPLKGKCLWWREFLNEEDRFDRDLPKSAKRVQCVCFVEGGSWQFAAKDVPRDCPVSRSCRYHIAAG